MFIDKEENMRIIIRTITIVSNKDTVEERREEEKFIEAVEKVEGCEFISSTVWESHQTGIPFFLHFTIL